MSRSRFSTVILLLMAACCLACGCLEVSATTRSVDTLAGGAEIVEHTYLWGDDGFMTKTYDVRVTALGIDIASVKGVSRGRMEALVGKT